MDSKAPHATTPVRRRIFREEAMRVYVESNAQAVLPRFTTPLALVSCWLLVVLLGVGTITVWFSHIPVTASGEAVVVAERQASGEQALQALVFLPPDRTGDVHAGDDIVLRFGTHTETRHITSVDSKIWQPDEVRKRFELTGDAAQSITQPAFVAVVNVPLHSDTNRLVYPGATGSAEVVVGSQRIAAFLPFIGDLLG